MNLKEQEYVCVLAECGNITKAAEKLYISQPALSIYISNLEKTLGVKLFDRSGKRFTLTLAGELYMEKAGQMLRLNREFEEGLADLVQQKSGKLTIAIQLRRAPLLLAPVAAKLGNEYPNVKIIIKEGVQSLLEEMLQKREFDLLIYNLQVPYEELVSHLIYQDQMLLALPGGHSLLQQAISIKGSPYPHLNLAHCLDETFILPTKNQSLRSHLDRIMDEQSIRPRKTMEIRNFETAMQMVAEGIGIGFNREQYAKSMSYYKPVVYCTFAPPKLSTTNLYVSYLKGKELTAYMERALELFIEEGRRLQKL